MKMRCPNNSRDSSETESDTELKNKRKKHLKNESKERGDTNETTNVKHSTEQQCMVDTINKLADQMRLAMGELSQKMVDF